MAFEPHTYPYGPSGRAGRPPIGNATLTEDDPAATMQAHADGTPVGDPLPRPDAPSGAGPSVAYDRSRAAPSWMDEPIGLPGPETGTQDVARGGFGSSGIPPSPMAPDAVRRAESRRAMREERKNASMRLHAAKSIARADPESWDSRIERFNRGAAPTLESIGQSGNFLTRDDVMQQARRPVKRYPQHLVAQGLGSPYGPAVVGARDEPSTFRTANGSYEPRMVGGKAMGVPVIDLPGFGAVPDPALPNSDFDRTYTREDAGRTARAIYRERYGEFQTRQRRIDSGRAALLDDTLTPEQRDRAELQLDRMENDLHREFLRTVGHRMTTGEASMFSVDERGRPRDEDRPDAKAVFGLARDYAEGGMAEADAYSNAERALMGERVPFPKRRDSATADRGFDFEGFIRQVDDETKAQLALLPQHRQQTVSEDPVRMADLQKRAFAEAIKKDNGMIRADRTKFRQKFDAGLKALAKMPEYGRAAVMAGTSSDPRIAVRSLVVQNLPAFVDSGKIQSYSDIERLVEEIVTGEFTRLVTGSAQ